MKKRETLHQALVSGHFFNAFFSIAFDPLDLIINKCIVAMQKGVFLKKVVGKIFSYPNKVLGNCFRSREFSEYEVDEKKIFFFTFQGDYTCNPKYITEGLIKQNVNCKIVWGVRERQLKNQYMVPNQVIMVDRYTYDFYREMATSKIWIINSVEVFKNPLPKKKEQILIETWHGSLGIKRFDASVNSGKAWVEAANLCGKIADYCISNSKFENSVYRETFWRNTELLEVGHPRNDILFLSSEERKELTDKTRTEIGVGREYRLLLYGPTFRDSHEFDSYDIDYKRLIENLKNKFGGEWKILVRFHPTVRSYAKGKIGKFDGVVDVTDYPDIQELMMISDVAITDYSSWIYDYVLSRKPGCIFATDIEEYNTERGFYYPLESTPFLIARSNDELIENILKFNDAVYRQKVEEFLKDKGCFEDGHASERVVEKIKEIIGEK